MGDRRGGDFHTASTRDRAPDEWTSGKRQLRLSRPRSAPPSTKRHTQAPRDSFQCPRAVKGIELRSPEPWASSASPSLLEYHCTSARHVKQAALSLARSYTCHLVEFAPTCERVGAYGVAIDPDGRIVAAGTAGDGGPAPRFGTVRYLADGTPDPTFGGDGTVSTDLTPRFDSAWAVALQADGSVVCSGVSGAGGSHASFGVVQYQP